MSATEEKKTKRRKRKRLGRSEDAEKPHPRRQQAQEHLQRVKEQLQRAIRLRETNNYLIYKGRALQANDLRIYVARFKTLRDLTQHLAACAHERDIYFEVEPVGVFGEYEAALLVGDARFSFDHLRYEISLVHRGRTNQPRLGDLTLAYQTAQSMHQYTGERDLRLNPTKATLPSQDDDTDVNVTDG